MSQFLSSNEMFINMKDAPRWDPKKNYFDQEISTLDFYEQERRKITEGVMINGYYMHPWLYWHINFFKTPIPIKNAQGRDVEKIMCPPIDDNFLYIIENYQEAEKNNLGICLFGTRGFAKSTALSSLITWTNSIRANGTTSVIGGSDLDLKAISKLIQTGFNKVNPAFFIPQLITEWESLVEIGLKEKDGFRLPHSHISITNANKGTAKSSEKGAGLSPVGFIMDEIGKFNFKDILNSALPSFITPTGAKLVHVLSGTSGNEELSKDAKDVLSNPEDYSLITMDWDKLERNVDPDYVTWERSKKQKFSIFVPAQMSYRLAVPKVETTLDKHLNLKNEGLSKVKIQITDWKTAKEVLTEKLNSLKKEESKEKQRMYYPLEIDDVFLTSSSNPFPTALIDKRIRFLEDEGLIGKNIEVYRHNGKIMQEFSPKKRAEVSHPGGEADAPAILFADVPEITPPKFTYVSGLDDYKLDQSETSSLGAFYIIKRRNLEPNSPCEKIVLSHTTRPFRHGDFHKDCEKHIDIWNSLCNMEAVDVSFKQHLDTKNKAEQCLAPSISFSNSVQTGNYKLTTKFGVYPTAGNKSYMFNLVIDFMKEEHVVGIDEDGNEIIKYGVDFIDDIDLLKEMLSYKKGGNFDRIIAFMHALAYARELDKLNIRPDQKEKTNNKMAFQGSDTRERPKINVFSNVKLRIF
jgi:hypothetical protein